MRTRKTSLVLLAATTLVVAACSSNNDNYDPDPPMANVAPTIAAITSKTENQDTAIGPFDVMIQDRETPANMLTVTATADNDALFAPDSISVTGNGTTRSLTLMPLEARTGAATVTVTVIDAEGLRASQAFSVTVNARNASVRDAVLGAFVTAENGEPTAINGYTFAQDADEGSFDALVNAP